MEAHSLIPVKANPKVQDFNPGDTVRVSFRVREGERERVQAFQGVVIKIRGGGISSTFTVRRVTYNIGIERTFPLYSPLLESVEVVRSGVVRRAKLYYLRGLSGRAARIKEKRLPRGRTRQAAQQPAIEESEAPVPAEEPEEGTEEET